MKGIPQLPRVILLGVIPVLILVMAGILQWKGAVQHGGTSLVHPRPQSGRICNSVSVIISAHNEHAFLARTLESLLSVFPGEGIDLISIVVVDDGSVPSMEYLQEMDPRVVYARLKQRSGIVPARNRGFQTAMSVTPELECVVFLDAHVRVYASWLSGMADAIGVNDSTISVPMVAPINQHTWEIDDPSKQTSDEQEQHGDVSSPTQDEKKKNSVITKSPSEIPEQFRHLFATSQYLDEKFDSRWARGVKDTVPILSGGMFMVSVKWWQKVGAYPSFFKGYGSENIYVSLRQWSCGGHIAVSKGSLIGHVFGRNLPYQIDHDQLLDNKAIVIESFVRDEQLKIRLFNSANIKSERVAPMLSDISKERATTEHALTCSFALEPYGEVFNILYNST